MLFLSAHSPAVHLIAHPDLHLLCRYVAMIMGLWHGLNLKGWRPKYVDIDLRESHANITNVGRGQRGSG